MDKIFYSLCTNGKYSDHYPAMVARSLQPYGWKLICLIDKTETYFDKEENLEFLDVRLFIPNNMGFTINGWWYKLVFFNPTYFDQVLFVDIDSIFTGNPDPILSWIDKQDVFFMTTRDWIKNTIATPLMYIDHNAGMMERVWDYFYTVGGKCRGGDQDFIHAAVDTLYEDVKGRVWREFPKQAMCSYKVWFGDRSVYVKQQPRFLPLKTEDFISFTFHGKPSIVTVVKEKLNGWKYFEKFVENRVGIER
jgi:hypothetical protein